MTAHAERFRDAVAQHPRVTAALLVLLSSVVLLARLGTPDRIIFDETFYVEDALGYLETGVEPSFAVHPTVGKWLIAGGIAAVGDRPLGWRIAAALAGVITVLLTHLLARRLLAGRRWGPLLAVAAPVLLLTDGLFATQSRIAMLDSFLVTFTVAGTWLLVVDRDRRVAGLAPPGRPSVRWLAGVAFGLAVATKWNGLLALGAAGLLTIAWELTLARRTTDDLPALVRSVARRGTAVLGSLVVVPAVVYGLTWLPWLASYEHTWAADCEDVEPRSDCADADAPWTERVDGLGRYHEAMIRFHLTLESEHSYRGDPLGWVVLQRPVAYYWETCSEERAEGVPTEDEETGELVAPEPCRVPVGTAGLILALGNPVVWWGFLAGLPLLVGGVVRRDRRSAVVVVPWLSLWVPWLVISQAAFLFYLTPAVPFLALGVVLAIDRLDVRLRILGAHLGAAAGALLGLAAGWALQAVGVGGPGWRPRLLALVVGTAVGTVLGALRDLDADRRAGGRPGPVPPSSANPGRAEDGWPTVPGTIAAGRGPDAAAAVGASAVGVLAPTAGTASATDVPDGPREPNPGGPVAAPAALVPALTLVVVVGAIALWTFFGPIWYGVPLDREVLRWRWWLSTWV